MDPDANLKEQRELASRILHILNTVGESGKAASLIMEHAARLAELEEALDKWIAGGGFLPAAWRAE